MNKWIAEFDLEDGDTMPEHMDLEYKGAKLDFHCRPMWIPVSERLPEKGRQVLCCNKHGSVFTSAVTYIKKDKYGHKFAYFGKHYEVIAWTPLLKSYEPQESE